MTDPLFPQRPRAQSAKAGEDDFPPKTTTLDQQVMTTPMCTKDFNTDGAASTNDHRELIVIER